MLRVGLTGGLGSGKSTAAAIFKSLGAHVLSADEIGRGLMQPGQRVYDKVVASFGPKVVRADGQLDRAELARRVFADPAALQALNHIVHPAVIVEQELLIEAIAEAEPDAVVMVESALIFEVERDNTAPGWTDRFDKIVLITAPDEVKLARYLARLESAAGRPLEPEEREKALADGRQRMAMQISDAEKSSRSDFVVENSGNLAELERKLTGVYEQVRIIA